MAKGVSKRMTNRAAIITYSFTFTERRNTRVCTSLIRLGRTYELSGMTACYHHLVAVSSKS